MFTCKYKEFQQYKCDAPWSFSTDWHSSLISGRYPSASRLAYRGYRQHHISREGSY